MSTQEEFQGCLGGCCGGCPSAGACAGCPNAGACDGCPNAGGCGGCPNAGGCGCGCEGEQQQFDGCGCGGCGGCQETEEQGCGCGCCGCEATEGDLPYQTYGMDEDGYLLLTEDGGVKKKIIKEGTGDLPPAGSKVTGKYILTFQK